MSRAYRCDRCLVFCTDAPKAIVSLHVPEPLGLREQKHDYSQGVGLELCNSCAVSLVLLLQGAAISNAKVL